jgi:hypothetical protein
MKQEAHAHLHDQLLALGAAGARAWSSIRSLPGICDASDTLFGFGA